MPCSERSIKEVKETWRPVAIFHRVEMVGLDSPRSTQHALAHAGALRRLAEAQVHITTQIFQIVRDDRIHIRHKIIGVHDSSQAFLSLVRR